MTAAVVLGVATSGCVLQGQAIAPAVSHDQIWGYHAWWSGERWQQADSSVFDKLLFFALPVGPGGQFSQTNDWPLRWWQMRQQAATQQQPFSVSIILDDVASFEPLFSSTAATDQLIANSLLAMDVANADGIHVDIEIFSPQSVAAVAGFKRYVQALRQALDERNRSEQLSMFVLTYDAAGLFDQSVLGTLDYAVLQGYDSHWPQAKTTGSVAQLKGDRAPNWQVIVDKFLALGLRRDQIIMSFPYYGYEWPAAGPEPGAKTLGEGKHVSYAPVQLDNIKTSALEQVAEHGLQRDPDSGSPYYRYQQASGEWVQGWFEDPHSLKAKLEFVRQQQLAGVAMFPVSYDNNLFVPTLQWYRQSR